MGNTPPKVRFPAISIAPYRDIVALIVEPRQHPNLKHAVTRMAELYPDMLIYVYHGTNNQTFAREVLYSLIQAGQVVLFPLEESNLNAAVYNSMFKTREFWETVNAGHALVFQTDVHMCTTPSRDLHTFLKYDYVGAPFRDFMNGGLSLRNVQAMKRVVGKKGHHAEDVFFSRVTGLHRPPHDVAALFAVQTGNISGTPIGVHKPWHRVKQFNPELEVICPGVQDMAARNSVTI